MPPRLPPPGASCDGWIAHSASPTPGASCDGWIAVNVIGRGSSEVADAWIGLVI